MLGGLNLIGLLGGGGETLGFNNRPIIHNNDGTISTERSITITDPRINKGRPTNIPSIWGGQQFNERAAIEQAIKSGQNFESFDSIDEAVKAAVARSKELGRQYQKQIQGY